MVELLKQEIFLVLTTRVKSINLQNPSTPAVHGLKSMLYITKSEKVAMLPD
jgi:hypothetical protein